MSVIMEGADQADRLQRHKAAGFTLAETMAVIFIAGTFVLVMAPAVANNRDTTRAALCLKNLRQLTLAWSTYAEDNGERLVQNHHGGEAQGGAAGNHPQKSPWALGWLDWNLSPDNTNDLFLRDVRYARLAPYLHTEANVHKCPADVYVSPVQRQRGWKERVRTVVMNGTLGEGNATTGPWDPIYRQAKKINELINPVPAETSVFFDEHPDSINDPFFFPPRASSWIDLPGSLHQGAGSFSFADGHVELHGWRASARNIPVRFSFSIPPSRISDPDRSWRSYRSQRVGERSY